MSAGRPTLLTPSILEDVRRILPTVMYLETVADYIGVHRTTIRLWLKRGRKEDKRLRNPKAKPKASEALYLQFIIAHKKCLAEGEIHDAGVIKKAASEQWQAAAWRLERRFPDRWGRERNIKVDVNQNVKIDWDALAAAVPLVIVDEIEERLTAPMAIPARPEIGLKELGDDA